MELLLTTFPQETLMKLNLNKFCGSGVFFTITKIGKILSNLNRTSISFFRLHSIEMYLLKSGPNINCPGERLETSALCTFVGVHLCPLTHLSTLIIDRFGEVLLQGGPCFGDYKW